MPAKLLFRDGQGKDASVDIPEATPIFLGRGADCAVRTDDAMVSRKNCKLSFAGGRFFVEDLGSSNGTYVNERKIQKQQLNHGDVIRCGTLQVRYVEVAARARTAAVEAVQNVQVADLGGASVAQVAEKDSQIAALNAEREAAQKASRDATAELEQLRARTEGNENELKLLRQQVVGAREDLAKVKREHAQDKEELHAVSRAAEELRTDSKKNREDANNFKGKVDELTEELAAKDRQLERAQEEVQRTKQTTEELRNKLGELQKTKDEGWRELNSQLSQVEQLREVITEQERILEERRVGLIALESASKDLRTEKEKILRELVDVKNQRDDLRDKLNRSEAKVEGLEEEHRRLARMMGGDSGGTSNEEISRMAGELRELKVDAKKIEIEKARALENLQRIEADREKLLEEKARMEVERGQLLEDKKAAESARSRAEEARARAESTRQRLEEEKQQAAQARDAALATADEARRDLDRAQKKLDAAPSGGGGAAAKKAEEERDEAVAAKSRAESKAQKLEDELKKAKAALDAAKADSTPPEGTALPEAAAAGGGLDLRARAQEVYDGINEALSELRTTILTAKGLFGEVGPRISDEDMRKALGDAIANSMDRTEDAKGLLRGLKELAQT
jgi:pSer/pThr/pTyr-binding forkhead associated (FHA) protein